MSKELEANTTLSHYRIVSKLGAGGMGEVYLAQDTSELGRTVALKILPPEIAKDKDRLQRFTQEARTVSNLNHPNILTVHEFGRTDSHSFFATEYVDGLTLREHLSKRRLKLLDILDVAIQIVGALNAAHDAGVTHRDLKPENVMVRKDHIVKVLDFGLAKLSTERREEAETGRTGDEIKTLIADSPRHPVTPSPVTNPGVIMGTVSYMSPEQSAGHAVDHRTDIWSAGVVMYEMIAGVVPFPGKDIHRQIIAIQEEEPTPLLQHVEGVPDRLEEIISKCLAKEKDERYQTAKDLLIDLRNLRRKLDVDAEIERTVAPAFRSTTTGASASTQASQNIGVTSGATATSTASSAEYIVTGIKQHKLAAAIVGLIVVGVGVTLVALYFRGRTSSAAITSIAVMPFVNEGGKAELEYLSDGMTDTLISSLSQIPNLSVKARSSVFRYKGKETNAQTVAKELNIQALLNGRIAQRGDQLTMTLELVDAQTENVIWSEQFNRKEAELVSLQSEIARVVSTKIRTKLSGTDEQKVAKTYTTNPEAYQLYLKGLYNWNKRTPEALKTSVDFFKQATEKDPNYAQAYAGMALAYVLYPQYSAGKPAESIPQAKLAARKALDLDETLAEAHTALGQALFSDRKFAESGQEYRRAIELNPNYATAHQWYAGSTLVATGRFDEAIAEGRRAVELDPLSLIANLELSAVYGYARQHDQAINQLRKVVDMDPNWYLAHMVLGQTYSYKGQFGDAIAECEKARSLDDDPAVLGYLARAYALSGRRDDAMKTVAQMHELARHRYVPAYGFVFAYSALGEKDQAFQWLERSFQDGAWEITTMKVDPALDSLRSDPRFDDLVRQVGL